MEDTLVFLTNTLQVSHRIIYNVPAGAPCAMESRPHNYVLTLQKLFSLGRYSCSLCLVPGSYGVARPNASYVLIALTIGTNPVIKTYISKELLALDSIATSYSFNSPIVKKLPYTKALVDDNIRSTSKTSKEKKRNGRKVSLTTGADT